MATRTTKQTASIDIEDAIEVNDWAIIANNGDSAVWEKPTTGETIRLPTGAKPTARMIQIAILNGAILSPPEPNEPHSFLDDLDNEPSTPVDRVVTLLQSTVEGTRAEVKIYRMRDGDKDSYCGSFTPEQFEQGNLELIRANFGGGKFRIKVYATAPESGKFAIRMNETVEIEQSALPSSLGNNQMNPMDALMKKIDQLGNNHANSQPQNSMHQLKDMLGMFVMMKQVFGGGDQQRSSVGEIAQAIRELKDISGELGSNNGGGNDLMGMGTELIKLIADAKQGAVPIHEPRFAPQRYQPSENAPDQFMEPNSLPQIQVPENPIPEAQQQRFQQPQFDDQQSDTESNSMNMFVKLAFKVMLKKAAINAPVEPIAKDLYEKLPDEILDTLETSIWFDALQEFAPEVAQHEEWFTMLRTAILAEIAKDQHEG